MQPVNDAIPELDITDLFPGRLEVYPSVSKPFLDENNSRSLLHQHFHTQLGAEEKQALVGQIIDYLNNKGQGETYSFFQRSAAHDQTGDWQFIVSRLHHTGAGDTELVMFTYEIEAFGELKPRLYAALENAAFFKNNIDRYSLLTKKEKEILQLIGTGLTSRDISASLHTSVHTVNTHRNRIRKKLAIDKPSDMLKYASTFDHHP